MKNRSSSGEGTDDVHHHRQHEQQRQKKREVMFQVRDSPFTIAMRDPNHRATFSLFLTAQLLLFCATFVFYIFDRQQLHRDTSLFVRMFSPIEAVFYLEFCCTTAMLLLVPVLRMRQSIARSLLLPLVTCVTTSVIIIVPLALKVFLNPHPVLSCGLCMQQIRFIMKLVSFVAENRSPSSGEEKDPVDQQADQSLNNNNKSTKSDIESQGPGSQTTTKSSSVSVKSLLYFLVAPTCIYAHSYPRSRGPTNWGKVICYTSQWSLLFLPSTLLISHKMLDLWSALGSQEITVEMMYYGFLWSLVGSALFWLGIGYCFLHCWLNAWAEVLSFGDRLFYRNWWSSTNGLTAWSMWNFMIHKWISRYIYVPCIRRFKSRTFATLYTFTVSALFHDYLISFAVGFPFPYLSAVVIVLMTPLTPLFLCLNYCFQFISLPPTNVHVFTAAILSIALGMIACELEYNSRINCDITFDSEVKRLFVPHSPYCLSFDLRIQ